MPNTFIKPGVTAGKLYETINNLTGMQPDNTQGPINMGPNNAIAISKDGQVTLNPKSGIVNGTIDNSKKLNNQPAEYYGKNIDTIHVYTHSYDSGSKRHNFTGNGDNGKVLIKAAYHTGDTFAVNGKVVSAFIGSDAVSELYVGRWMGFFLDSNKNINFKGGGLSSADKQTVRNYLAVGHSIMNGKVQGTFTSDANAQTTQLNQGATAYVKGKKIIGVVPLATGGWEGNTNWRQSSDIQIWDGKVFQAPDYLNYYNSGVGFVGSNVPALTASNIKKGVQIGTIQGTYDGPGIQYQCAIFTVQTYDTKDTNEGNLSQSHNYLQIVGKYPQYIRVRALRTMDVLFRMSGIGNVGVAFSKSDLTEGWNHLNNGQEFNIYASLGPGTHGSNLYRVTSCSIVF